MFPGKIWAPSDCQSLTSFKKYSKSGYVVLSLSVNKVNEYTYKTQLGSEVSALAIYIKLQGIFIDVASNNNAVLYTETIEY